MPAEFRSAAVLVVGVGYVGGRVLRDLPEGSALGLSRRVDGKLPSRAFDLDRDEPLAVEPASQYAVLYTVPPARTRSGDPRLQRLLEVLPQPPTRFVYLSSSGVYGDRKGARVDESGAPAALTERAKKRVAAEQLLSKWCTNNSSDLVVLRVPGIYGPGRLGADRIEKRDAVLTEQDTNPGNRIHVDDLAGCCVAAVAPDVPAGIYNVGDGDLRSSTWFAFEVARQSGLPPPPTVSREQAEQLFSPERLSFQNEARRLDINKMREILRPEIRYPDAADGIAASLKEEP